MAVRMFTPCRIVPYTAPSGVDESFRWLKEREKKASPGFPGELTRAKARVGVYYRPGVPKRARGSVQPTA